MANITERREVRVDVDDTTFVFVADPDSGRLSIEEHNEESGPSEVCAVTISDVEELRGFLEGLARVLGLEQPVAAGAVPRLLAQATPDGRAAPAGGGDAERQVGPGDASQGDRDAVVERARQRNPHAFKAWTREEERAVRQAYEGGVPISEIAKQIQRSQRAVEMRLERLGLRDPT